MREEDAEKLIDAVKERCPGQSFVEQAPAIWAQDLANQGITYEQAEWIVNTIAKSRAFIQADFKRITIADIINFYLRVRQDRLNKAGPLPPAPDPDNVRAYLNHHRSTINLVASGRGVTSAVDLRGSVSASERRVQALRARGGLLPAAEGDRDPQESAGERANDPVAQMRQEARDKCRQASEAFREGRRPQASGPPPRPPAPDSTRAAANHPGRDQGTTRAGDALRGLFGSQNVPDWIDQAATQDQAEGEDSWCGRCHRQDRTKIILDEDGVQTVVECCTPERVHAAH